MHEIIFKNGSAARPYVEIVELFIERENAFKWAVSIGQDMVIAFDKEEKVYTAVGERTAFTNTNAVWAPRLTSYWNLKQQAKDALISALKQDDKLFNHGFLFWEGSPAGDFNILQREKLLCPPLPIEEDKFSKAMEKEEERVNEEAQRALNQKETGIYFFTTHGYRKEIKIEEGKVFGVEEKKGKQVWYPTFLCAEQINRLEPAPKAKDAI